MRELDVLMVVIEELSRDNRYRSLALNQVGGSVANARIGARERLAVKLPVARMKRLAARLKAATKSLESKSGTSHRNNRGPKRAWLLALEAQVGHRARRVRSALETVSTVYVPDRLHDVRIALTKQ